MFENNILAERLHLLRTQANISQKVLAEAIGVSYHSISKIENKQRAASIEVIIAIAEYFNVSLDYLTGRADNPDISDYSNDTILTSEESELLEDFRILNKHEQNIIIGRISEMLYNKNVEKSNIESAEEINYIELKDRLNK